MTGNFLCGECGSPISQLRRQEGAMLCGGCEQIELGKDMKFLRVLRYHAEDKARETQTGATGPAPKVEPNLESAARLSPG